MAHQLTMSERDVISNLHLAAASPAVIARAKGWHHSTISRELAQSATHCAGSDIADGSAFSSAPPAQRSLPNEIFRKGGTAFGGIPT